MNRRGNAAGARRSRESMVEAGKTALIVLLLVSALILCLTNGFFGGFGGWREALRGVAPAPAQDGGYASASSPFYIVVTPESGAHSAVMYDSEALSAAYERFSPSLGEALGSSGTPEKVTEEEWYAALKGESVYFDFLSDQLLSVLGGWLGTSVSGGAGGNTARRICLAREEDGVALYYYRVRRDAGPYRCSTALNWSDISARVEEFIPNGAAFNYELEEPFPAVDSCAIILKTQSVVPSMTARDPLRAAGQELELLGAFGLNSVLTTKYYESDGTVVCVDVNATLRIEPGGRVVFSSGTNGGGDALSPATAVETVRALCAATVGRYSGAAGLYLSYIQHDAEAGSYTVRFDYTVNGLPVQFSDGAGAVEVTISGSELTYAVMRFREYSKTDSQDKPLPSLQEAAIVQACGGGEPLLCYLDDTETVTASWLRK